MFSIVIFLTAILLSFHVGKVSVRKRIRDFSTLAMLQLTSVGRYQDGYFDAMEAIQKELVVHRFRLPFETRGKL